MHLVQLLLPVVDTAGTQIPAEVFAAIRRELTERFGGVTAYTRAPAKGLWKKDAIRVEADEVMLVEVVVDRLDRDWWRGYRSALERRFAQDTLHVRALAIEQL